MCEVDEIKKFVVNSLGNVPAPNMLGDKELEHLYDQARAMVKS